MLNKQEKIDFLKNHYTYSTGYEKTKPAIRVKYWDLQDRIPMEDKDKFFEFLSEQEVWDIIGSITKDFEYENPNFSICSNGRSNGYFVLVYKDKYYSQMNYLKEIEDIDEFRDSDIDYWYNTLINFDNCCEQIISFYLDFIHNNEIVEEEIQVLQKVKIIKEIER